MLIIVGVGGSEFQKCPLVNKTDFQERKYIMHCSLSDSLEVPFGYMKEHQLHSTTLINCTDPRIIISQARKNDS